MQVHHKPACPFQTSRCCAPSRTRLPQSSGMPCGGCTPLSPPSANSPPRTTCTGTGQACSASTVALPCAPPTGACHARCGNPLAPASQPEMCPRAGGHGLISGVRCASLMGGCRRLQKTPREPLLERAASAPVGPSGVGRAPRAPAPTAPLSPTACTRCSSPSSRRPTTSGTTGPPRVTASEHACRVHGAVEGLLP